MIAQTRTTIALLLCAAGFWFSAGTARADSSPSVPVRLIGTAIFQGDASALVEIAATGEQKFVDLNESISGYTVRDIQPDHIVLDMGGKSVTLTAMGTQSPEVTSPMHEPITISDPMIVKQAPQPAVNKPVDEEKKAEPVGITGLAMPIAGRVVSGFGQRKDPWGGGTKTHQGVDIAAPQGTRIRAANPGTVVESGYKALLGNYVKIDHGNGYETVYGHMYKRVAREGQHVEQGDLIGYEGSTGRSTGPHLHFAVLKNGEYMDPGEIISALEK